MAGLQLIGKWLDRCELALLYVGVLATFLMMCLTSVDAFSRYLLRLPITGAYELTEKYFMVAAIFLGLSYAYRGGGLIRVTFLVDRLPAPYKLLADYFAHFMSLVFCLIFVFATARQAFRALSDATMFSALPLPVGPSYSLVPIGFFFLTMLLLIDLCRVQQGKSFMFVQDAPTS
jgi:TRAP-type C4-dicarboxylate transport system permease small subunit